MMNIYTFLLLVNILTLNLINCETYTPEEDDYESKPTNSLKKSSNGYVIKGQIKFNDSEAAKTNNELPNVKIMMNGKIKNVNINNIGNFEIMGVSSGVYNLDFIMKDYFIPAIRVIVDENGIITVKRMDLNHPLESTVLPYPIELILMNKTEFYVKTTQFSILSLLSNPMVISKL